MTEFTLFVLIGLAVWRITSLLVNEAGPFDIFAKFRFFIGVRYDAHSKPYGTNVLAQAFVCVWCLSLWVSLIGAIFSPYPRSVANYIVSVLALSAIAIIIDKVVK